MQGRRGAVGSLPETLFDHGSSSSNADIDEQVCWNNILNPVESRLSDCLLSANDMNIGHAREEQGLGRWRLGGPSSSDTQSEISHNERKTNLGWSSSGTASAGAGPRLEERRYEHNTLFGQSSNSNTVPWDINLNASLMDREDMERSLYMPSGSESERISAISGRELFLPGYPYEDHRASCKRKTLEGNVGQSSASGSSNYVHRSENSSCRGVPASYSGGSSVNISSPTGQVHPRLGLDVRGSAAGSIHEPIVLSTPEGTHRNLRRRINPIQEPIAPPMFSTGDTARHSVVSSQHSSRSILTDHSLDFSTVINHVPTFPRNVQPFRWNGGSGSRIGSSSSSGFSRDRSAVPCEGHQSRSAARNLIDHPIFVPAPELRSMVRNPTSRGLGTAHISVPGNVASTYLDGSSSGTNASSAATWVPNPNPSPQYPRRLSELVRRSLMSSLDAESGGHVNHSPLPNSPEEMLFSSGIANQGHHRQYPRPVSWSGRQDAGLLGVPHPLRTLAAATEGRSRLLASEIRNVVDLMRRGRFEDIMILEQSLVFGVADIHDRHRDMRLDVDNMSYEELLALEDRIGNVNTGLGEETILNRLKQRKYSSTPGAQLEAEPCCVCQEEYNDGENLGVLECGHNFHADCIKQWLMNKNLCPICKTTGLAT